MFPYFCFISQRIRFGGGGEGWGQEVTVGSNLGGATCNGGLVDAAGSVCFLIKPS